MLRAWILKYDNDCHFFIGYLPALLLRALLWITTARCRILCLTHALRETRRYAGATATTLDEQRLLVVGRYDGSTTLGERIGKRIGLI